MAYEIQGLIGRTGAFAGAIENGLRIVQLSYGLELLPLGKEARSRFGVPFLPLTDEGLESVPDAIALIVGQFCKGAEVAYIEAEYFGGEGAQAFALFKSGSLVGEPCVSSFAINEALGMLGVESSVPEQDEFEAVGLGKYRSTDAWL